MGLLCFSVMSTPTKQNKRCHVASGRTPNEKKKNRPERNAGSRKSLAYDSVERNKEVCDLPILDP